MGPEEGGSKPTSKDQATTGRGELVSEPTAVVTDMMRDRFRRASALYLLPGVALVVIGALLWIITVTPWYIFVPFIAGGAFLVFMGLMILSIYTAVPRFQVFEGGVLVKAGRGSGRFHAWSEFADHTVSTFEGVEVLELHLRKGGAEPISIIERVPEYDRVRALVERNVSRRDGPADDGA